MFSDGISIWKFIQPIIIISFILSVGSILILQPFASYCLSKQEFLEKKLTNNKVINTISLSDSGFYISELIAKQQVIYTAKTIIPESFSLSNVTILFITEEGHFIKRIDAPTAILKDKKIELINGATEIDQLGNITNHSFLSFFTHLDFNNIIDKFASPENISFWKLGNLTKQLTNSGIKADKFVSYYYKLLFRPVYVLSIVLVAICFLNLNPRGKIGIKLIGSGCLVGLLIHSFREIMSVFLISSNFSYALSQIIPALIIIVTSLIVILQKFET